MPQKIVLGPFAHGCPDAFSRADIEFYGVDAKKPSYTALIFINDPDISIEDATEDRDSFAGTFSVFGHANCAGDEGHCAPPVEKRRFDDRPSSPLTPAFRRVSITQALRDGALASEALQVTLIATTGDAALDEEFEPLLDFKAAQLVTFI